MPRPSPLPRPPLLLRAAAAAAVAAAAAATAVCRQLGKVVVYNELLLGLNHKSATVT